MTESQASTIKIRGAVLERAGEQRPYAESRPLNVSELELSAPGEGEVLVRITAAGVCHSDLSVVNNDRPRQLPMLLGHEAAGVVEQLGPGVTEFEEGDQVVMTFVPRCGECDSCNTNGRIPCERGTASNNEGTLLKGTNHLTRDGETVLHHVGVSGFATHAVVSVNSIVRVGRDVPSDIAAVLGCAILTGGGAVINEVKPGPNDTLAVVGLGGVGMAAIIVAKALGVKEVVGIDMQPQKLEKALELGADRALTPQDAVERGERFSAAIEAAGNPRALETAYQVTAAGGTTVTVGLPASNQTISLDPLVMTSEARRVHGSYLGSAVPSVDIPRYEQMWRDGKLHPEVLISSHIHLDDINDAMDKLADGAALRQIIMFD